MAMLYLSIIPCTIARSGRLHACFKCVFMLLATLWGLLNGREQRRYYTGLALRTTGSGTTIGVFPKAPGEEALSCCSDVGVIVGCSTG